MSTWTILFIEPYTTAGATCQYFCLRGVFLMTSDAVWFPEQRQPLCWHKNEVEKSVGFWIFLDNLST
jgi:hypothetical protein